MDIGDAFKTLIILFRNGQDLPCDGPLQSGGNLELLNFNGDATVNLADVVGLLAFLFQDGDPHALGTNCVRLEDCENLCR